jgi:hypothetical protein
MNERQPMASIQCVTGDRLDGGCGFSRLPHEEAQGAQLLQLAARLIHAEHRLRVQSGGGVEGIGRGETVMCDDTKHRFGIERAGED